MYACSCTATNPNEKWRDKAACHNQLTSTKRGLGFRVDEAVGGPVVTVRSADSGEVVRQIPNEVIVKIAHNIDRAKGLLFNGKA